MIISKQKLKFSIQGLYLALSNLDLSMKIPFRFYSKCYLIKFIFTIQKNSNKQWKCKILVIT